MFSAGKNFIANLVSKIQNSCHALDSGKRQGPGMANDPSKTKPSRKFSSKATRSDSNHRSLVLWIGLVVILAAVALYIFTQLQAKPAVPPAVATAGRTLGQGDAPVTIVEYGDFGCTTCKAWHELGVKDEILKKYGEKVRFVWHDFPVITAESPKAAEAGLCANDQAAFWKYHDVLYAKAPELSTANLKDYAAQLGMDAARFNQCLDSGQHKAEVDQDTQDGFKHGFRGTPSFLVNGKAIIGPPTVEQLSTVIDTALQEKSQVK
jgi:protein-disulfide isomerase